jgi:hypothetical protein
MTILRSFEMAKTWNKLWFFNVLIVAFIIFKAFLRSMAMSEINFIYSLLSLIDSVYYFCIVVWNISQFGCFRYWKSFLMDQSKELASLIIVYLYVLSNHCWYCLFFN